MNWYLQVLKKYAVFSGRARRAEYWMYTLFNIIISVALGILDLVLGTYNPEAGIGLLGGVYALAVLVPSLAVSIRRLHDTNHSGWWLLIGIIPIIGAIVLIVFMVREGTRGSNQYGHDPKDGAAYPPQ